jgi:hypothetical protein
MVEDPCTGKHLDLWLGGIHLDKVLRLCNRYRTGNYLSCMRIVRESSEHLIHSDLCFEVKYLFSAFHVLATQE